MPLRKVTLFHSVRLDQLPNFDFVENYQTLSILAYETRTENVRAKHKGWFLYCQPPDKCKMCPVFFFIFNHRATSVAQIR